MPVEGDETEVEVTTEEARMSEGGPSRAGAVKPDQGGGVKGRGACTQLTTAK